MPGAWEIMKRNSVLVGVLHVDTTTVAWSLGLRSLIIPGPEPMCLAGMPFDHARNMASMRLLESGLDYLFFLDSDVVPPRDTILRLMSYKQPIVSGVYCRRSPPASIPVMLKNGAWYDAKPNTGIHEVDLVGAGCLLISREVIQNLPPQRPGKHWFDWRVDMQGILPHHECLSEDFTFCHHARQNGYRILVDTGIQCKHVGLAQATYGKFEPLDLVAAA